MLGQGLILWRVKQGVECIGVWEFNQNSAGALLDDRRLVHGQQLPTIPTEDLQEPPVIVGNSIRLASEVESGDALG
jgi:hypothetical protein